MKIKVVGPGCPNCDKLEQMIFRVMAESNIAGDVEHVRDLAEIANYGLVPTPVLVININSNAFRRQYHERFTGIF